MGFWLSGVMSSGVMFMWGFVRLLKLCRADHFHCQGKISRKHAPLSLWFSDSEVFKFCQYCGDGNMPHDTHAVHGSLYLGHHRRRRQCSWPQWR